MSGYKKYKDEISTMYKIYSKRDPSKLLHLVHRLDEIEERTNVADDNQFLQLATLRMQRGKTFRPHRHVWKSPQYAMTIAQESWVVIQGSVEVSFYDTDGTLLEKQIINRGDCSMTFEGGHTYTILEDDTVVYEYKTGPYYGQDRDKVFI
jgi:cupin fold WbuC family metalloprotein